MRGGLFAACVLALAAVGCGDDTGTTPAPTMMTAGTTATTAGTGAAGSATAGATAAGTGATAGAGTTGAAGTTGTAGTASTIAGTGAAGMASGTAGMPPAGTAGTGAAGTGAAGGGAAGTGASGGAATLTMVAEKIYSTQCAVCHGMAAGESRNGNLGGILNKQQFYDAVVGKASTSAACMGKGMYIVPGNPAESLLLKKLMPSPPCGAQMPPGSELPAEDIALLTSWIMGGAKND